MKSVDPSALQKRAQPAIVGEGARAIAIGRPQRVRPWGTVRILFATVLIAGLAATVGFDWWDRTAIHSGGPVALGSGILGQRLGVGEPTTFGGLMLTNWSSKDATLERIWVRGVSDGFEVLAVGTKPWPNQVAAKLNDAAPRSLAAGLVLDGSSEIPARNLAGDDETGQVQLRITGRALRPGVAYARGVEIRYRVGDRQYRRSFEASMYLCAPAEDFATDTCRGDGQDKFNEKDVEVAVRQ